MKYKVHSIFPTIQGEGRWTGYPITLLRLAGCNLKCDFCDTLEASWPEAPSLVMSLEYLVDQVKQVHRPGNAILITGGEPTLQSLGQLAEALPSGSPLYLETNGTQPANFYEFFDWITVSPKPRQEMPLREVLKHADEIKWLVASITDVFDLQAFLAIYDHLRAHWHISVQPISCDKHATEVAIRACIHYGWQLSIQVHKYIDADSVYGGAM